MTQTIAITTEDAECLFTQARTAYAWQDSPVPSELIEQAWDMAKFGPTAMNCQPLRVAVVSSPEGKGRLVPHMGGGNQAKVDAAPVSLVLAADPNFHERMPEFYPQYPGARDNLASNLEARTAMASKNAHLQAAYLLIALRAVGLACGPMDGMDFEGASAEFFADSDAKAFMVINVGYAQGAGTDVPRNPRISFDDVAKSF